MNHIHDRFFKSAFSQPGVVASLIEDLFPPELASAIEIDSLRLTNDSYIDDSLTEHLADLIYTCSFRDGTSFEIALLLEHKSYIERYPHLQLLRYITNRWQEDIRHERKLTPIVPVIIYHGSGRWSHEPLEQSLAGMNDSLRAYLPEFDYILVDLSVLSDEQIMAVRSRFLRISGLLLKYRHRKKRQEELVREVIAQLFNSLSEEEQRETIQSILLYILNTTNLEGNDLVTIFSGGTENNIVMTGFERLRLESQAEIASKLVKGALKLGMDARTIADTFEMDVNEVEKIIERLRQEKGQ